ncbi:MAG: cupin-like domain-containing protein [Pseudomonadota bacterium]
MTTAIAAQTRVLDGLMRDSVPVAELIVSDRPAILKGLARDWPLVAAGRNGPRAAVDYLLRFSSGRPVVGYTGREGAGPRFFYDDSATRLDFSSARVAMDVFVEEMLDPARTEASPALYIGSTEVDAFLPGLRGENDVAFDPAQTGGAPPPAFAWIGTRTTAAAHFDFSNNIAVCAVGRRRFTLFPPDQVSNLYPGPLDPTPGGQVISMVDFDAPDLAAHPGFADACAAGEIAELEPGDALFLPAMWWHQVEALDAFNVLVNYWWNASPSHIDTPYITLLHALIALRDRPEHEKRGWRALFDHYVFGPPERAGAHLPEGARGPLGPMDALQARRLRAMLLNILNR